jgi:signal transduction histidine kinase
MANIPNQQQQRFMMEGGNFSDENRPGAQIVNIPVRPKIVLSTNRNIAKPTIFSKNSAIANDGSMQLVNMTTQNIEQNKGNMIMAETMKANLYRYAIKEDGDPIPETGYQTYMKIDDLNYSIIKGKKQFVDNQQDYETVKRISKYNANQIIEEDIKEEMKTENQLRIDNNRRDNNIMVENNKYTNEMEQFNIKNNRIFGENNQILENNLINKIKYTPKNYNKILREYKMVITNDRAKYPGTSFKRIDLGNNRWLIMNNELFEGIMPGHVNIITSSLKKIFKKDNDATIFEICDSKELITYVSKGKTYYVSYGTKGNGVSLRLPAILSNSFAQIKGLSDNYILKDLLSNPHHEPASCRRYDGQEMENKVNVENNNKIIGLGYNLKMADPWPGIYYNGIYDISDQRRIAKYRNTTCKSDSLLRDRLFQPNELDHVMEPITIKSVDVAYYLPIDTIINKRCVRNFYATFGVYRERVDDSFEWGYYKTTDDNIIMKMNDNAFAYNHPHVKIFNTNVTCTLIDTLFREKEVKSEEDVNPGDGVDFTISFDNIIRITENYYYLICVIDKIYTNNNVRRIKFVLTKHDFILTLNGSPENLYLGDYKIVAEETAWETRLFSSINDWLSKTNNMICKDVYPITNAQIEAGKYVTFMNQQLVIVDKDNITKKFNIVIKLNNDIFNEIALLYRRKEISVDQLKNAANIILTKNIDQKWGLQLDYLKSTYIALLVGKYVAYCNRIIINDYNQNEPLYKNSDNKNILVKCIDGLKTVNSVYGGVKNAVETVVKELNIKERLDQKLNETAHEEAKYYWYNQLIKLKFIMFYLFYWRYDRYTVLFKIGMQFKYRNNFFLNMYKNYKENSSVDTYEIVQTIIREQIFQDTYTNFGAMLSQLVLYLTRVIPLLIIFLLILYTIFCWYIRPLFFRFYALTANVGNPCMDLIGPFHTTKLFTYRAMVYLCANDFSKKSKLEMRRRCHPDKSTNYQEKELYRDVFKRLNEIIELEETLKERCILYEDGYRMDECFNDQKPKMTRSEFYYKMFHCDRHDKAEKRRWKEQAYKEEKEKQNKAFNDEKAKWYANAVTMNTIIVNFFVGYYVILLFKNLKNYANIDIYFLVSIILLTKVFGVDVSISFFLYILLIISLQLKGVNLKKRVTSMFIIGFLTLPLIIATSIESVGQEKIIIFLVTTLFNLLLRYNSTNITLKILCGVINAYHTLVIYTDNQYDTEFERIIGNKLGIQFISYMLNKGYSTSWIAYIMFLIYSPLLRILYVNCDNFNPVKTLGLSSIIPNIIFGACSSNDIIEMLQEINEWTQEKEHKYKFVIKYRDATFKNLCQKAIKQKHKLRCDSNPVNEYMTNKTFSISGFFIDKNYPYKLHRCVNNEIEAIYRQLRVKIRPDPLVLKDFSDFCKKRIDKLFETIDIDETGFMEYIEKFAPSKNEYLQGYKSYEEGHRLDLGYKMHSKTDEKFFINYGEVKLKSRNISAQSSMAKSLMGFITHTGMKMLHDQEWAGPGKNNKQHIRKFQYWIDEIPNCSVLCVDGSAFDSTQHREILECVDAYFLTKIRDYCADYLKYVGYLDLEKVLKQTVFTVTTKHFKYTIQGTQMSGRMNTCLCNTLRSHLYIEYGLYKANLLDHIYIKHEVTGDDQIIFMPKYLVDRYITFARKYVYAREDEDTSYGLGQIAKTFDVYHEISGAEYLSLIMLYDQETGKIALVRKPDRFLQMTPFTFRNDKKDLRLFYYLQSLLAIGDFQNVKDEIVPTFISKYISKMNSIAKMNIVKMSKYLTKYQKNCCRKIVYKELNDHLYSQRSASFISQDKVDEIFNDFLYKKYNITLAEIEDLYEKIDNVKKVEDNPQSSVVDKLNAIDSIIKAYKKEKILEDNRAQCAVSYNKERNKIEIIQ